MRNLASRDIAWLGGLLEGEGCFAAYKGLATIKLNMTDSDTVQRAAGILAVEIRGPYKSKNPKHAPQYHANIFGCPAAGWMMTLYQFLGNRRRHKVRAVLAQWRANVGRGFSNRLKTHCPRGHQYSPHNTYLHRRRDRPGIVSRHCITCRDAQRRANRGEFRF